MTIARFYILKAAEGKGDALATALTTLADATHLAPNSEGVDLLRDAENDNRFFYFEKWPSIEAHLKAGEWLNTEAAAPVNHALKLVAAAIDHEPESSYIEYFKIA